MKRKILWMLLSWLIVAALVLSSCAKEEVVEEEEEEEEEEEVVEEEEEEEEVVAPPVGEPQRGGTLTWNFNWGGQGPDHWEPTIKLGGPMLKIWGSPYLERLLVGDVETYGPRGTNDYPFKMPGSVPEQYLTGELAESWEWVDPLTLAFNIRQGVFWTGNAHIGMEARELTAYDIEFVYHRQFEVLGEKGYASTFWYLDSITATDRYTLVVEFKSFHAGWAEALCYGAHYPNFGIYPPETVEAGIEDWKNHCGTGPFILTDYQDGVGATYVRNPNYWGTTTINGKEYQRPFIDKLVHPVIVDISVGIAALRTGRLDWMDLIPIVYADTLAATSPDLIQDKVLGKDSNTVTFRTDLEPWSDRNVRRAFMIGSDYEAIIKKVYIEGEKHTGPACPYTSYYTPFEELPESAQVLYSNDPDLARQLLDAAGIPAGFKMTMNVSTGSLPQQDIAEILVEQWARFNVEVEIVVRETGAHSALLASQEYQDTCLRGIGVSRPHGGYSDRYINYDGVY